MCSTNKCVVYFASNPGSGVLAIMKWFVNGSWSSGKYSANRLQLQQWLHRGGMSSRTRLGGKRGYYQGNPTFYLNKGAVNPASSTCNTLMMAGDQIECAWWAVEHSLSSNSWEGACADALPQSVLPAAPARSIFQY